MKPNNIMELLINIDIQDYPYQVQTSVAKRAEYYVKDTDLPAYILKGINKGIYKYIKYGKKEVVADTLFGTKLLRNGKVAGKPTYKKINGQDLHTLNMQAYFRSKIINTIKDYVLPCIIEQSKDVTITEFPIGISLIFFTPRKEICDLDNHKLFYEKCIIDLLTPVRKTWELILMVLKKLLNIPKLLI